MKFLKQKKIIIVLVASMMVFLGAQKAEAGKINFPGGPYENDGVKKACFCCPAAVTVVNKTYDTPSSIDGCAGTTFKGYFQFLSQCKATCPGGSVVLYDSNYSSMGNTYITNRLTPLSVLDPPVTTPNPPVVPSSIDTNAVIPGNAIGNATEGIVQCGRAGQQMCKLCDLIKGIYTIIKYVESILFGVFILAFMIGGIIYITSSGESSMMEMGKKTLMNAAVGIVIVLASYLIVFTVITYLGTKPDMGMTNVSWDSFDCAAAPH